jgi:hypothetical protein
MRVARGHRSPSRAPLRGSLRSVLSGRPGLRGGRARSRGEEGLGGVRGQVADHASVDDIREVSLEDAAGLLLGVVVGAIGVDRLARGSQRSWVTAIRCRIALMRRLPPGL